MTCKLPTHILLFCVSSDNFLLLLALLPVSTLHDAIYLWDFVALFTYHLPLRLYQNIKRGNVLAGSKGVPVCICLWEAVSQMRNVPILSCTLVSTLIQNVRVEFFRQKYSDWPCMKSLKLREYLFLYICQAIWGNYNPWNSCFQGTQIVEIYITVSEWYRERG